MVLPHIWRGGQIFAFSALEGEAKYSRDLVGLLSGDKIGIRFFTSVIRELALAGMAGFAPTFEAVTGDMIIIRLRSGERMHILYAAAGLVIGNTAENVTPVVMVEGEVETTRNGAIEWHDSRDGEYTAIGRANRRFAFAYGKSAAEVTALVEQGLAMPLEPVVERKLAYYQTYGMPEGRYAALHAKCLSVMKTQLYSSEGQFSHIWSTPDRLPHKDLWLWDSVFHALGFRHIDGHLAEDLILAVFDTQKEDGFIPHSSSPTASSTITQPPVLAYGAWRVYEKTQSKPFLQAVFAQNKKFLLWCHSHRREGAEELYTWLTDPNINCRCGEFGMDNSPRFDTDHRLEAIDFSCFMANEARYMEKIANVLGMSEEARVFADRFAATKDAINRRLWCEEDELYYDRAIETGTWHKVRSVASFLPLFAGVCDAPRAAALLRHLCNPREFGTPFPIPSISRQDESYGSDMWRGPVWVNYNVMLAEGLWAYGYTEKADAVEEKTIAVMDFWYQKTGTIFEFYDSENERAPYELNRKGPSYEPYNIRVRYQAIRDYGWSTTLLFDLLTRRAARGAANA